MRLRNWLIVGIISLIVIFLFFFLFLYPMYINVKEEEKAVVEEIEVKRRSGGRRKKLPGSLSISWHSEN